MENEITKFQTHLEKILSTIRNDVGYIWSAQKIPDSYRKHLEILILDLRIAILSQVKEICERENFYSGQLSLPLNQAVALANGITKEIHVKSQNELGVLLPFPGNQKPIFWRS